MEKEKLFEASIDQVQTSTAPADPSASGCESTSEAESENQLWVYVTLQPGFSLCWLTSKTCLLSMQRSRQAPEGGGKMRLFFFPVFAGMVLLFLGMFLPSVHQWSEAIGRIVYLSGRMCVLVCVIIKIFYHSATSGLKLHSIPEWHYVTRNHYSYVIK